MYKDIISYKLANGVTEEHLLSVAQQVVESWMNSQKGFIKWEINKDSDGNYTDIVYWKTKDDAKKSELDMMNIPNAADWFACYEEGSIKSVNLSLVSNFE